MTEKEKAEAGLLYDANYNPELLAEREHAAELCYDFNNTRPSQTAERTEILRHLLGSMGRDCIITPPFHCDNGYNIHIGNNFFANYNLVILDSVRVSIGDNVFIAPNVGIYCAGHPFDPIRRNQGLEYALPVTIGNDVWIGAGTHICPGVSIGDGSTIGAGSIVTHDIPEGVIAAGNPCRILRKITQDDIDRYK